MVIIYVAGYLIWIFCVIGYVIYTRLRKLEDKELEPDTFVVLGFLTLIFGLAVIYRGKLSVYHQFQIVSLGIAIFAIGIALFAWGKSTESYRISVESKDRMEIIGRGDIQGSIITLLDVRRRYFENYTKYFNEYKRIKQVEREIDESERRHDEYGKKKSEIKDAIEFLTERLRNSTEWATWEQYRGIMKALKYKQYFKTTNNDKKDILLSHEILIKAVMKRKHIGHFLMNRHVNQLLMGIKLLKKELKDLKAGKYNYEKRYKEILKGYLLKRQKGEHFISWINRNLEAVSDEDKLFRILSRLNR